VSLDKEIKTASEDKLKELLTEIKSVSEAVDSTLITMCSGKPGADQIEYMRMASMRLHDHIESEGIDLKKVKESIDLVVDMASIASMSKLSNNEENTHAKIDKILEHVKDLEEHYNNTYSASSVSPKP